MLREHRQHHHSPDVVLAALSLSLSHDEYSRMHHQLGAKKSHTLTQKSNRQSLITNEDNFTLHGKPPEYDLFSLGIIEVFSFFDLCLTFSSPLIF